MAEVITLNDENWVATIGDKPALLLISSGDGVRSDFNTAFKKAASTHQSIVFAQIDPRQNPKIAAQFEVGDKPVLVGWYQHEMLVRRSKPWGSDVVLSVELLENTYQQTEKANQEEPNTMSEQPAVNNKPFVVTDQTFQQEVIEHSKEVPVLVDFWAEWCGPCRMVAPIMEKLAADYAGQVRIAKVDTDANPGLSQAFQIMSIPTIMVFKDGHLVFNQPGAFPEAAFRDLVDQVIALDVEAAIKEQEGKEN